jgi:hypothetical protein
VPLALKVTSNKDLLNLKINLASSFGCFDSEC